MTIFLHLFTNPWLACLFISYLFSAAIASAADKWRAEVLPIELGVGYAVVACDISGDGRLDIAIVDSKRFVWLENPTWKTHVMQATPDAANDNVCFAPHDVDGDGHIDFAVGHDWQFNNSDSGGFIGWLHSPSDPRQPWNYHRLAEEPTTHRMRWVDWNHDGKMDLVVAPLKGRHSKAPAFKEAAVRLLAFTPDSSNPLETWPMQVIDQSLHVMHNFDIVDLNADEKSELITASFEGVHHLSQSLQGVTLKQLGAGQAGVAPAIGSSEIRLGQLSKNKSYIATIEPWHGDKVVVYTEPIIEGELWKRQVIDAELKWGHAVACANLDDDPEEELIIGVRDSVDDQHRCGVRIYNPTTTSDDRWKRRLIEPGQVAVEDLTTGDFDGDGDLDIVAVGRATHNAVIYWNE